MARLVRNDAVRKLPQGVKLAKWTPIVVIPSAGADPRAAGTHLANMRRQGAGAGSDNGVRIRFPGCCDEHKQAIKLSTLATAEQLMTRAKRLADHIGHARLRPQDAKLEWEECRDDEPCSDCMDEAKAREEKAKQGGKAA